MNEYMCPCGYRARGNLEGILRASADHQNTCPNRTRTTPVTEEFVDPDCRDGKHPACPGWTFNDTLDRATPCECACHDPEEHTP